MIMMIMNIKNKLYTIRFFQPFNDQFTATCQAVISETKNGKFCKIPPKFELPDKIGFELKKTRSRSLPPGQPHS